ncbi:MarR family transcriptional regulator, partial [Microtetraspora sp. AC03309]|nr:MarR family transcriptional regulator [Microtetraspora sp. AC03309]
MLHLLHRQRVVHLLRTEGPLARADLADRLGLSRPSITTLVGELIDDGTLVELDSRVEGPGYRG